MSSNYVFQPLGLLEMKTPIKSKFLQLFERDQGRCVYCGMDLKADYDRFMMATEDHLVPTSKAGTKDLANCILSCTVCNRLKGDFVPEPALDPVKKRREYVTAVRAHIMKRRSERMKEFMQVTHPGQGDYQ
jgi:5-methylcytosine-specific restriction endonuclease McrA